MEDAPPEAPEPAASASDRSSVRAWLPKVALGFVAGLAICLALPPWGWWPLAPVGIALWLVLLDGAGRWQRFWTGWAVGVGWFGASTLWMWWLTPPGYVFGNLAAWGPLVGLVSLACPPDRRRLLVLPAAIVFFEWFHSHAPFGGIPLSMLAMTQTRAPLLSIATVAGSLALTGAVAGLGSALYLAAVQRRWREPLAALVAVAVVAVAGLAWPLGSSDGTVRVAVVQGGGPQGTTFTSAEAPLVFQRNMALNKELERGDADLILWPENVINVSGAFDGHPWESELIAEAQRLDATILVGVVEDAPEDPTGQFLNYEVAIHPDGSIGGRYDKVRRVPFGEYVPMRSLMTPLGGDALPSRDQVPGEEPAMIDTPAGPVAVAISWEIFFARRVREGVRAGGEMVLNPTNGSSYHLTQVQTQQVASSILRATESRRWVLQSAPTGFSAVVDARGRVMQRTAVSEAAVLFADVPLLSGTTPAQALGDLPGLFAALAAITVAAAPSLPTPSRRRASDQGSI